MQNQWGQLNSAVAGAGQSLADAIVERKKQLASQQALQGVMDNSMMKPYAGFQAGGGVGMMNPDYTTQRPLSDPQMMGSMMNLMNVNPELAKSYIGLRQMTQPTYDFKEIPRGGTLGVFQNQAGQPPQQVEQIQGQPFTQGWKKIGERVYQNHKYETLQDPATMQTQEVDIGEVDPHALGGMGSSLAWKPVTDAAGTTTGYVNLNTGEKFDFAEHGIQPVPIKPTSTTRTMIETAPRVKDLTAKIRPQIEEVKNELGPGAGRWTDFWTGKVGADNPKYNALRVNTGLLSTLLMRMHMGARGGEIMMQKFSDLLGLGHQSPENLNAALDEIDSYANDLEASAQSTGKPPTGAAGKPKATKRYNPATGQIEDITQ